MYEANHIETLESALEDELDAYLEKCEYNRHQVDSIVDRHLPKSGDQIMSIIQSDSELWTKEIEHSTNSILDMSVAVIHEHLLDHAYQYCH